jgi:hypothetical protein
MHSLAVYSVTITITLISTILDLPLYKYTTNPLAFMYRMSDMSRSVCDNLSPDEATQEIECILRHIKYHCHVHNGYLFLL